MSAEKVVIGNAELWHGDCREVALMVRNLKQGHIDAVITDPPYGIGFEYASYEDSRDNLRDLLQFVVPWGRDYAKRSAYLCGVTQTHMYPEPDWMACVTWDTTGSYGKCGYTQWMPVMFYGQDVPGFGNVEGAVTKSDVYRVTGGAGVGFARREVIAHPCPKPVNVMNWAVARFSLTNEIVCDPFMGSGTTGVACAQMGRRFVGIELDRDYFKIACERISRAQAQGTLLPPEPVQQPVQEALL